jgi:class 3 adenylate cyclase
MTAWVPPWRRPRRLRRQITAVLAITSLVAVLLFGVLNFVAANDLLVDGTTRQLESVAESRARSIELGADGLLARVATSAADRSIVAALRDLADPATADGDAASQTVFLDELAGTFGAGDLLLLDAAGTIVFSRVLPPGSSLTETPLADTTLARLVLDDLERVRVGTALASNVSVDLPGTTSPILLGAAAIRDGTEVVGTLVVELDVAALDNIANPNTGERPELVDSDSYVVAADLTLQSTPRSWQEDPAAYLAGIDDDDVRARVEEFGSPVGVQPIDTEPVRTAFDGERFVGQASNAEGASTYASALAIDLPGVEWVVVTETPLADVRRPLIQYLVRMGVVVAIVLPISVAIGFLLARRLTKPIPGAVAAAQAVADGERRLDLHGLGNDEFGDLARRLSKMAETLERQERALEAEYERKRELLLSVLPPRLVAGDGVVSGTGERVDLATVVAVSIETDAGELDDDELTDVLAAAAAVLEKLATERGVDRVRVSADRGLFVAGAGTDDDGADVGLDFATGAAVGLAEVADETAVSFTVHVGVSTGAVAAGVLTRGSLTFAAWGEPVRRALAISALSAAYEVLVDASTIESAGDRWDFDDVDDVIDLDGSVMPVRALRTGVVVDARS